MTEETATPVAETQESVQEQSYQDWKLEREGKKTSVAEVQAESDAESESAKPKQEEEGTKPKGKGGFQDRINQLHREKKEAQEERDRLKEELAKHTKQSPSSEGGATKPKLEDFTTHEEFVEALTDWKFEQREKKAEQDKAQSKQKDDLQKTFDAYNKKIPEAIEKYPDFEEVVGALSIPRVAQLAIVEEDNSTEIAYYLGKNPDIAESLSKMSDVKAVSKIGRIAAQLEKEAPEKPSTESSDDKKPETKVPPPIKSVGGSSARSTVDPDKLPMKDFIKWREKNGSR